MTLNFVGALKSNLVPDDFIEAISDPGALRRAIPRCRSVEPLGPGSYRILIVPVVAGLEFWLPVLLNVTRTGHQLECKIEGVERTKRLSADGTFQLAQAGAGTDIDYNIVVDIKFFIPGFIKRQIENKASYFMEKFMRRLEQGRRGHS